MSKWGGLSLRASLSCQMALPMSPTTSCQDRDGLGWFQCSKRTKRLLCLVSHSHQVGKIYLVNLRRQQNWRSVQAEKSHYCVSEMTLHANTSTKHST